MTAVYIDLSYELGFLKVFTYFLDVINPIRIILIYRVGRVDL